MINNDHSRGSVNLFTASQLQLYDQILASADLFFNIGHPESRKYELGIAYKNTPIYLIPYDQFEEFQRTECLRMYHLYLEARKAILKNASQEDKDKLEEAIKEKYYPWSVCDGQCFKCNWRFWVDNTPLGYFDSKKQEIYICLDKIIEKYPSEVDEISAKVLLHELGHAIMFNPSHRHYMNSFEKWVEESLANKIALKYLAVASHILARPGLFTVAEAMVKRQSDAYKLGLYLYENNGSDWYLLRQNKTNFNEGAETQWMKNVQSSAKDIVKIQAAFYKALNVPTVGSSTSLTSYETWLEGQSPKKKTKSATLQAGPIRKYTSFVSSLYMGTALKEIMGWDYERLGDCYSSKEVYALYEAVKKTEAGQDFHWAAFGQATTAILWYYEFLRSLGL